ncbi:MAG: hypothetical protein JWP88_754, partial [Flaviaesturariibacter sp.]|nr:hypothetical protein [Flaviaesturariibacter sp.]
LKKAKLFQYRPPKFFNDYLVAGLNNTVFIPSKYQAYQGPPSGPISPSNGNELSGLIRLGTLDLFEDYKISGGFRIAPNLKDNDILFEFTNLKRRFDWGFTYFRSSQEVGASVIVNGTQVDGLAAKTFANYYLGRIKYALDKTRSIRATIGPRFDRAIISTQNPSDPAGVGILSLLVPDQKTTYIQSSLEYVHDNTLNPATNIWHGLRWKAYTDIFSQVDKVRSTEGRFLFNAGFDARHYLPIYRNVIWAVRAAGDFSWGSQKVIYYLGGTDGWLKFGSNQKSDGTYRYLNPNPVPDANIPYAYQALAVNLRGFKQNVANGNNNVVINSEVRMPVFSTFFNRPINNAFLRNFQVIQFFDLGTAWNGTYNSIKRPNVIYQDPNSNVSINVKAGGIGPFAGGYGFGARSTLLGYFVRFDAAWQMNGFFRGKPQTYLSLGLDF